MRIDHGIDICGFGLGAGTVFASGQCQKYIDSRNLKDALIMNAANTRTLPGLPAYGPPPQPFPASGQGAHREGLVVEFDDGNGNTWVGNFQRWLTSYDAIFYTFGKDRPIIISGGKGYVVDIFSRTAIQEIDGGSGIHWCLELPERGWLVVADDTDFEAYDCKGLVWRSGRVSWDGMRNLTHRDGKIFGEAYTPMGDFYIPFELDLNTGIFTGGSYNGP